MKPTIGRVVHYTNLGDRDGKYPPEIQAAIITKVRKPDRPEERLIAHTNKYSETLEKVEENDYFVSLRIFYEDGEFIMREVPFTSTLAGTEKARGHWAWPARE